LLGPLSSTFETEKANGEMQNHHRLDRRMDSDHLRDDSFELSRYWTSLAIFGEQRSSILLLN